MKVRVSKHIYEEVQLDKQAVREVTLTKLFEKIYPGEYIKEKNGEKWLMRNNPEHRDDSIEEILVRKATKLDLAILMIIESIKSEK